MGVSPKHYHLKYKVFKQSLVPRFSYAIFYLVEEDKKRLSYLKFYTQVEILK
jgi:hypothetical protein